MLEKLLSRKDRIGPHVITPTGEKTTLYHNYERVGRFRKWECKYCGLRNIHPENREVNISWLSDCDGVEWLESEKVEFRDRF